MTRYLRTGVTDRGAGERGRRHAPLLALVCLSGVKTIRGPRRRRRRRRRRRSARRIARIFLFFSPVAWKSRQGPVGRSVGWAGGEALSEDKRAEVRAPICPRIFYPALVGWIDACVLGSRFGLGLERLSERREMAAEARNMPLFPTLALPLLQLTKPVEDIHTKIIPI